MNKLFTLASAAFLTLGFTGAASAGSSFASAQTGWSANSSFSTFGNGSHSFGGMSFAATGSQAGVDAPDSLIFVGPFPVGVNCNCDSSTAGAVSASGGFGFGSASTFSGLSQTSMSFMGEATSGAQAGN